MKVKAKKCKGTGQATNSGCGKEVVKRIYGLCEPCYYDWLLNTEAGRIKLAKSTLQGKRNYEKKVQSEKKEAKEKLMSRRDWLNLAQKTFNKYIRTRDKGRNCFSCGKRITGVVHASHYLSQGNHSAVRFHEDNVWACCYRCNVELSGNLIEYRKRLIQEIGEERVEWLENNGSRVKKWDIEEIKNIIKKYKEKTNE